MADSPITFDTINAMSDPLLENKWVCTSIPQFSQMPKHYVEGVNLPFPSIQQKEGHFIAGTYINYPGYVTISAFDMTFYEDNLATTLKYFTAWRNKIWDPGTGLFYLAASYKRNMKFALLNQKNAKIAELTLHGCWPTAQGPLDLQYTSADRVRMQMNFSVDAQSIEFM